MKYSEGFKSSIINKVIRGNGKSIQEIVRETGVSAATLNRWLRKHKAGILVLDGREGELKPSQRNPAEKFSLLLESRGLEDKAWGEWLRQKGLHSEHLPLWEQELASFMREKNKDINKENSELKKRNKELEKELARKEKALAEAAILITLKKKYLHLFQEDGEN